MLVFSYAFCDNPGKLSHKCNYINTKHKHIYAQHSITPTEGIIANIDLCVRTMHVTIHKSKFNESKTEIETLPLHVDWLLMITNIKHTLYIYGCLNIAWCEKTRLCSFNFDFFFRLKLTILGREDDLYFKCFSLCDIY